MENDLSQLLSLLTDLLLGAIFLWFFRDERKLRDVERKEAEERRRKEAEAAQRRFDEMLKEQQLRYDRLNERYIVDLGIGAAVNPQYSRWRSDDSKSFANQADATAYREELTKRIEQQKTGGSD